ncbi:MAG: hypothetical protein HQK54_14860 [Oligoflexales bacterium]|nr:hypothetical protein [Oligoflexales bacterium]
MPLVKETMEYFGGNVTFHSCSEDDGHIKDHGTTFILTFRKGDEIAVAQLPSWAC